MAKGHGCCTVKHGLCHTRLYGIWKSMKRRCCAKNASNYKWYGAKGITVCDEWKDNFKAFYDWAITNGYSDELTLERKDYDDNYCPENCTWFTVKQQANNRHNNTLITAYGKTQTLQQWADETGIDYRNISRRIKTFDWPIEKALSTPTCKIERRIKNGIK